MIGSVAVIAYLASMPHTVDVIRGAAAAGASLYALLTLLRWASSRRTTARQHSMWGTHGGAGAGTAVSNPVNTTSEPYRCVGASARWPGVWVAPAVCPPAAPCTTAPAAWGQRRRPSVRSLRSMTHQEGSQ